MTCAGHQIETLWFKATTRPLKGTSLGEDARGLGFRMLGGRFSVSLLSVFDATWRSTQSFLHEKLSRLDVGFMSLYVLRSWS